MHKVFQTLNDVFGFTKFRAGQQNLISEILSGHDVFGVLPTGGGKSLCYQLPAILLDGLTLVISPLIALMKDQVDSLKALNISAEILNTSLTFEETKNIFYQVVNKNIKLLYIAPERLGNEYFLSQALHWNVSMIAVDEAHCVSAWGHDFRPSYKKIRHFVSKLDKRPIVSAFTATATKQTQTDIVRELGLQEPFVQINSFDRQNIFFKSLYCSSTNEKLEVLFNELQEKESAIIYCNTRKTVDKVFELLQKNKFTQKLTAEKYHAGMSHEERKAAQDNFLNNRANIIVATNAFGMGIDKKDVRVVLHFNMPKNLEAYYQEAGRAGRDGLSATAILLYSKKDFAVARFLIRESREPLAHEKLQKMIEYCECHDCLRKSILNYFGETVEYTSCEKCSVCCKNDFTSKHKSIQQSFVDKTIEAQKILSCIYRVKQNFGAGVIVDILRESKNEKIISKNFDQLSTYGIMKNYSAQEIKNIISELLHQNFLTVGEFRTLKITQHGIELLKSEVSFSMPYNKIPKHKISYYEKVPNEELFEKLKIMRLRLAKKQNVPPFAIFSNKTLMNIAGELPQNEDEFLLIDGVGKIKCQKYSYHFLKLVRDFLSEKPETQKVKKDTAYFNSPFDKPETKTSTHLISLSFYNEGKSVSEIAHTRNLTDNTIIKHLKLCIDEGRLSNVRNEVASEKFARIKKAASAVGTEYLKPIKEIVGESISYDEIRLALLVMQASNEDLENDV